MFHGDLGSVRQDIKKEEKKEVREISRPKKNKKINMYNRVPRPHQKNNYNGNGDSWETEVLIAEPKRNQKKDKKRDPNQ